jgi:hypothetical protein
MATDAEIAAAFKGLFGEPEPINPAGMIVLLPKPLMISDEVGALLDPTIREKAQEFIQEPGGYLIDVPDGERKRVLENLAQPSLPIHGQGTDTGNPDEDDNTNEGGGDGDGDGNNNEDDDEDDHLDPEIAAASAEVKRLIPLAKRNKGDSREKLNKLLRKIGAKAKAGEQGWVDLRDAIVEGLGENAPKHFFSLLGVPKGEEVTEPAEDKAPPRPPVVARAARVENAEIAAKRIEAEALLQRLKGGDNSARIELETLRELVEANVNADRSGEWTALYIWLGTSIPPVPKPPPVPPTPPAPPAPPVPPTPPAPPAPPVVLTRRVKVSAWIGNHPFLTTVLTMLVFTVICCGCLSGDDSDDNRLKPPPLPVHRTAPEPSSTPPTPE